MRVIAVVAIVLCACSGGDDEATAASRQARCERLRDHVIDLRLASATNVDVAAHRQAMRQALGDDFVTACTGTMTEAQVDCALAAADSDAVTACSKTKR